MLILFSCCKKEDLEKLSNLWEANDGELCGANDGEMVGPGLPLN